MKKLYFSLLAVCFIASCTSAATIAERNCTYYGYKPTDKDYQRCIDFESKSPTPLGLK